MPNQVEFLTLLLRHEPDLRAFVCSLLADRQLRDEVFHDVAIALWRRFDEFDPQRSFGAWARGIAAGQIIHNRAQDARLPLVFSPQAITAVLQAFERSDGRDDGRPDARREDDELIQKYLNQTAKPVELQELDRRVAADQVVAGRFIGACRTDIGLQDEAQQDQGRAELRQTLADADEELAHLATIEDDRVIPSRWGWIAAAFLAGVAALAVWQQAQRPPAVKNPTAVEQKTDPEARPDNIESRDK